MNYKFEYQQEKIEYSIKKYRNSKQIRILIFPNRKITVTAPKLVPLKVIKFFIENKKDWIVSVLKKQKAPTFNPEKNKEDYLKNKKTAYLLAEKKLKEINQFYNFSFNKIYIKNQTTRWGSCSNKKNLNFNYRIIYLPENLLDYLITHELCHLKEMNHSANFWALITKTIPDFKERQKKLRELGKRYF